MDVEDRRHYAPYSVHLAVVLVDLRDDQEDGERRDRKAKARDRWVRRHVQVLEGFGILNPRVHVGSHGVELREEGLEGLAVVGAFDQCLHARKRDVDWHGERHAGHLSDETKRSLVVLLR